MDFSTSTRRHFLSQQAFGLGGLALASLMKQDELRAAPPKPLLQRLSLIHISEPTRPY